MLKLRTLRAAYLFVFAFTFLLFVAAMLLGSSFLATRARDLRVSIFLGDLSIVLLMVSTLAIMVAKALREIVKHIEALQGELAKFVENEADPRAAAQTLAAFLRDSQPSP
jgi:uncharacterized protein HemY